MKKILLILSFCAISLILNAQNYLQLAYDAYDNGDYEACWGYINRQCETDCNVDARYLAASVLYEVGEYSSAGQVAMNVVGYLDKKNDKERIASCYLYAGVAAYEESDYKTAVKLLTKAIKTKPTKSLSYYERALVYMQLGKYSAAKTDLLTSIKLDSLRYDSYFLLAFTEEELGHPEASLEMYDKLLKVTEYANSRVYAERAVFYIQRDDTLSAVRDIVTGMAHSGDMNNSRVGRVYNYLLRLCPYAMLDAFGKMQELEPMNPLWPAAIGDVLDETLGDTLAGMASYYRSHLIDPIFNAGFTPTLRLANFCENIEDIETADMLVKRALEEPNANLAYHTQLLSQAISGNRMEESISMCTELLLNPDAEDWYRSLHMQRGACNYYLGHYEAAIEDFLIILQNEPDSRSVNLKMGWCLDSLGRHEEARAYYETVLRESKSFYTEPKEGSDEKMTVNISLGKDGSVGDIAPRELPLALLGLGRAGDAAAVMNGVNLQIMMAMIMNPDADFDEDRIYNYACVFAQLDSLDDAMMLIETAIKHGFSSSLLLKNDQDLRPIWSQPETDACKKLQHLTDSLVAANKQWSDSLHAVMAQCEPAGPVMSSAHYMGGEDALRSYMERNGAVYFPIGSEVEQVTEFSTRAGEKERRVVQIGALVDFSGKLQNIEVEKSSGDEAVDQKAKELVEAMPAWYPAYMGTIAVEEKVSIPVVF